MDEPVPHRLEISDSDPVGSLEALWFWILVPDSHLMCCISVINRPSADACALGVWVWDDTAAVPQLFPYSYSRARLPTLPDDIRDVVIADALRLTFPPDGSTRLRFTDQDLFDLDVTFEAVTPGHLEEPVAGHRTFTRPTKVTGTIVMPQWTIELSDVGFVRREWGTPYLAPREAFGCSGVSRDLSFIVQWIPGDDESVKFLEGFVHRDGISARVSSARRVVKEYVDGFPCRVELTMVDELGRTTVAFGDTANAAHFHTHPNPGAVVSLTCWTVDGRTVWGADHASMKRIASTDKSLGLAHRVRSPEHAVRTKEQFDQASELVLAATRQFCQSIECGDFSQMQGLWERTRRVMCVLPGRQISRGWNAVAESLINALAHPAPIVVGNMAASIEGDLAWVTYDCDLVQNTDPPTPPILGVASTIFAHRDGEWLIIAHHASDVSDQASNHEL